MRTAVLQVDTVPTRDGVRVCVTGEIDCANAGLLGRALTAALLNSTGQLDVDLAEVSFLDSAGLKALARAHDAAGQRWRLVAVSAVVRWMLGMLGAQQLIDAPNRG